MKITGSHKYDATTDDLIEMDLIAIAASLTISPAKTALDVKIR